MTTIQNTASTTYLILGGARSGKSGYAEDIARHITRDTTQHTTKHTDSNGNVTYIATATAFDDEMKVRIERHQADRPNDWKNIEEPIYLAKTLLQHSSEDKVILVDCLTLWINNLLMQEDTNLLKGSDLLKNEIDNFINCLDKLSGTVIFVSNEVGMGVIPMGSITRQFVDESGRLHQQLGKHVNHVLLMVAGIATVVKGAKPF